VYDVIYALPGGERLKVVLRERKVKGESKAEKEYLGHQEMLGTNAQRRLQAGEKYYLEEQQSATYKAFGQQQQSSFW
jgi:hypothetical protein